MRHASANESHLHLPISEMPDRIEKKEFIRRVAARMGTDEAQAGAWVDGVLEFNPSQRLRALFGWSSTYRG